MKMAPNKVLFHLTSRGFYSEILNLLVAYLHAKEYRYEFVLYSKDWISGYNNGWTDYFLPFCAENTSAYTKEISILPDDPFEHWRLNHWYRNIKFLVKKVSNKPLYAKDMYYSYRDMDFLEKDFNLPELGIKGDIKHALSVLIKKAFRLNNETKVEVKRIIDSAYLPDRYIAIHVRRGDKVYGKLKEATAIELNKYIEESLKYAPSNINFYIATDDYSAFEEIQHLFPDLNFFTLCNPKQRGHSEKEFSQLSSNKRRQNTFLLLAETQIMTNAQIFIGTFSSNIGRALYLFRQNSSISLDIDWSPI